MGSLLITSNALYDTYLQKQWLCEGCGNPYNVDQMEGKLVDIVQRKCIRYQLQDLRCTKTQQVAVKAMAIPRSEFLGQITILRNLADFYGLDLLFELADNVLNGYA
jgi:DNA polymerase epsilon subunit 1